MNSWSSWADDCFLSGVCIFIIMIWIILDLILISHCKFTSRIPKNGQNTPLWMIPATANISFPKIIPKIISVARSSTSQKGREHSLFHLQHEPKKTITSYNLLHTLMVI